jgi:PAS domain S-box-containing protein
MPPYHELDKIELLQIIARYTTDLISVHTLDWDFLYVSPSCWPILGYQQADLMGKTAFDLFHPDDLDAFVKSAQKEKQNPTIKTISYRMRRKDNVYIWLESTLRPVTHPLFGKDVVLISVSRDISSRKASEDMVKKFVQAVEYASDAIVMTNTDATIIYTNPAVKDLTGLEPPELIGKNVNMVWAGSMDNDFVAQMWKTLKYDEKTFNAEVTNTRKDGNVYVADTRISPIMDQNRKVSFYIGISRDITKAKEVDRMKTEFISLASHQLRTPLAAVKWRTEMLLNGDLGQVPPEQKEYIQKICESNDRMSELVGALLNISRIESGRLIIEPQPTYLEKLLVTVLDDVKTKVTEKKLNVIVDVQTGIPEINIDPKLISNVFQNLITNAIKYTPEGGKVTISVYKDKDEIITKVEDSGYGIPLKEQARVFQKFFRAQNVTKVVTEGTGLGLYLVKAIIEASNGRVWFESEESKGTKFYVALNERGSELKKGEVSIS